MFVTFGLADGQPTLLAKFIQRDAADGDQRPGQDFGVAVLADHIGMYMPAIHAQVAAQQSAEAGGIQGRTGAQDVRRWQASCHSDPAWSGGS